MLEHKTIIIINMYTCNIHGYFITIIIIIILIITVIPWLGHSHIKITERLFLYNWSYCEHCKTDGQTDKRINKDIPKITF